MKNFIFLLPIALATATPTRAQEMLGARPAPPSASSILRPTTPASAVTTVLSPFVSGGFALHPGFAYRLTYSEALQSAPGRSTNSYIQTYAPSLGLDLGTTVNAAYTLTRTEYSNRRFSDTWDHLATLTASRAFSDLRLAFSEVYQRGFKLRVETGQQTKEESSITSVAGDFQLGQKATVSIDATQNIRFIQRAPDPSEWSGTALLRYRISNRLNAGFGTGVGYVSLDPGTDTYYYRPQASLTWSPTDRLQFDFGGGEEIRKIYHSGNTSLRHPFYNGSVSYTPNDSTTIGLTASRSISNSYFLNTANEHRNWEATIEQRLLGVLYLTGTYTDRRTDFTTTVLTLTAVSDLEILDDATALLVSQLGPNAVIPVASSQLRQDNVRDYEFALRTTVLTYVNLSASYRYSWNTSTNSDFVYSGKQITFSAGITF